MEKNYKIYCHKNKINNKLYIGYSKTPQERWCLKGQGYKKQQKFYRAILKYGWENFDHIILIENLSFEQAIIIEQYLIKKYNSKDMGYNATDGGEGTQGYHHSKETRKKMSEIDKQRPIQWKQIRKMQQLNKKRVQCVETNEIFDSAKEAAQSKNISGHHIPECCNGKRKTCGGYHWTYID